MQRGYLIDGPCKRACCMLHIRELLNFKPCGDSMIVAKPCDDDEGFTYRRLPRRMMYLLLASVLGGCSKSVAHL